MTCRRHSRVASVHSRSMCHSWVATCGRILTSRTSIPSSRTELETLRDWNSRPCLRIAALASPCRSHHNPPPHTNEESMNKTWIRGLTGLALVVSTVACHTEDITTANQNPNSPTDAPASALFTSATAASVRRWVGFGGPAIITQQLANTTYPTADSYIGLQADATTGTFNAAYTNDLQDFRQVISKGKVAGRAAVYGPAMVLQVWDFSYLTDQWGDVPYSDALKADSGVVSPKYD